MKKVVIGLFVLVGTSTQASMPEFVVNIQEKAEISGITINKDGSVTAKDILIKRGDLTYPVSMENEDRDYTSACRLLGFDNSLTGVGLNNYSYLGKPAVFLNTDGTLNSVKSSGAKIDKVTCFKTGQLKTVVLFDRIDNDDKSSKITNILFLRGDLSYPIAMGYEGRDYTTACKLLGFDNSLSGPGLSSYSYHGGPAVFLNEDGEYHSTRKWYDDKISKLTCYAGSEPSLVVLVSGSRYMRVIP
jgi:hypothetical protein